MIINISEHYKKKGFKKAYLLTNKEQRKIVILTGPQLKRITISYAKYLYTSFYDVDIAKEYHVDHINGDKTDDRIENLQVISATYNIKKDHVVRKMLVRTCPVCGVKFLFREKDLSTHPNPCCSRKCGGIKSHWNID